LNDYQATYTANRHTFPLEKGFFGGLSNKIFGESKEDFEARKAHHLEIERQRNEYMEKERARRKEDRKVAASRLKAAREFERKLEKDILKAAEALTGNRNMLAEAKANLEITEAQFKRLGEEKLELVSLSTPSPTCSSPGLS